MDILKIVDLYVLGQLPADDLPNTAIQALENDYDSASLRQLAGGQGHDTVQLRTLFLKALTELGVPQPSPQEAALRLARCIAQDVLEGKVLPYHGAKRIWNDVYARFPALTQLTSFVGLASEYEDDERHREEYKVMILDECKALLKT